MKKEIKEIDKEKGIFRVTTLDSRWYSKAILIPETGLPTYKFYPSSTWIASFYPKGVAFWKWLGQHGWDEAEAIKIAAGDKGSKVHYACSDIDLGLEVKMDRKYLNPTTDKEEELSPDEYECIIAYRDWVDKVKPELLANEITGFNEQYEYAGTVDKILRIGKDIYIVDLKTGQSLWPEQELQISSYSHLEINFEELEITKEEWKNRKLAILQIGYRRNKNAYKFTEIEDKFGLFVMAKAIFLNENPGAKPKQIDLPLSVSSQFRVEELAKKEVKVEKKIKRIKK